MDMVNISIGSAAIVVVLGMAVVFLGLILLMFVVQAMSRIFIARQNREKAAAVSAPSNQKEEEKMLPVAPGSAGECRIYDTDPREAAMIMAILADELKTPLNELRFLSIREQKK